MTPAGHYSEYKNSGTDWLGDIPAHWDMVKLKNGFDLQKRPAVKSAGIVTAFRDGQVTLRSNRRVDGYTEGDKQIGYQTIHPGDLVIHAMDAFAGAIGVSDSFGQSTPVYSVCTPKSGYNAYFYARALRHIALTGYITSLAKGVRERSTDFRWADAKELPVPRPSIEEQNKIVAFLDRETAQIDELIGKQERLIELLAEKRQAIITQAVTKGLDPTAPTKPSGIPWQGPVPEHWTVQPLKNLIRMQSGVTLGKDYSGIETETYPYLRVANVQIGYVDLNEVKEIDLPKEMAATSMLRAGDVLMTEGGDRDKLARGCIWEAPIVPCLHQNHIFAVRTGNQLLNEFLVLALDADPARSYFYLTGKQSTNLASTNSTTVKNYRFGVPPVNEQHRIVGHLGRKTRLIDDLVDKAKAVISTLTERRSALISAAVTGKIDVREGAA